MTAARSPLPPTTSVRRDDYSEVTAMFRTLRALPVGSSDHARQRDRIITQCLPLADRIARRYHGKGENDDDLRQIARVGLLLVVDRFDPENGADFLSFAVPTILGEVRRYFRDHTWAMRVPRRLKDLHVRISTVTPHLTQTLGRVPKPADLAEALNVPRDEIVESLVAANSYRPPSLDGRSADDDSHTRSLSATLGDVDRRIDAVTDRETLRPLLAELTERQRVILALRFYAALPQSQIADQVGLSQMHVSRILTATLQQLRAGMMTPDRAS